MKDINFTSLAKELEQYDAAREKLIAQGRVLLKTSKQLIYAIHRDNLKQVKGIKSDVEAEKKKLDKIAKSKANLSSEGSYSDALQEYVEAVCLYAYIHNKPFPSPKSLKVSTTDYLLGMCDVTGELTRRSVLLATKKQHAEVAKIRDTVDAIQGEFLKFNLRNGHLRKKYDQIKWNLNKIEDIAFECSKRE